MAALRNAWVVWPNPVNAQPSLLGDAAYVPTYSWSPGRTGAERQMIVVIAILSSCLMLAIAMWRSRWSVALLVSIRRALLLRICLVAHGSFGCDVDDDQPHGSHRRRGDADRSLDVSDGIGCVACGNALRHDHLAGFRITSACRVIECRFGMRWSGSTKRFVYQLPANARMAFVARSVSP